MDKKQTQSNHYEGEQTIEHLIDMVQAHYQYPQRKIYIKQAINRSHGLDKFVGYQIVICDDEKKDQKDVIQRRYREFFALRQVLVHRWPGCFIPIMPRKHITGSNSLQVVNDRVKLLSFFLNGLARTQYLSKSEEFQIFIHSKASDLKKYYEKQQKMSYKKRLQRFQKSFPDIVYKKQEKHAQQIKIKDIIEPQQTFCKQSKINLVNIQRQARRLSSYQQKYMTMLKHVHNETFTELQKLINFQKTQQNEIQSEIYNKESNQKLRKQAGQIKTVKMQRHIWIIAQALNFQLLQLQGMLQVFNRRRDVIREYDIIRKKILTNDQQKSDIKLGKFSLRGLFSSNKQATIRQIQKQNEFLISQRDCLQEFIFYVNEIIIKKSIPQFRKRRLQLWSIALKKNIQGLLQWKDILESFYETVLQCCGKDKSDNQNINNHDKQQLKKQDIGQYPSLI